MRRRLFMLLSPLGLTACGSLLPAQKYTPRTVWPLAPAPPAATGTAHGPVLLVRPLAAAPGLEARGLQSLRPDGALEVDYYNLWATPPADAVTQALMEWCAASGLFAAVVTPGSRLAPGLIVEGELTELLTDPRQGSASAALTLTLIKPAGGPAETALPVMQRRLQARVALQGSDAAARVAAQTNAVAGLLAQAMALLAEAR